MKNGLYERTERLIGTDKLEKLRDARVLVVGLGGVGGYIAEGLVRAGVGMIGLCDFDVIDSTNLNRQILATESSVGRFKVDVAEERIKSINPACLVRKYLVKISRGNLESVNIQSQCPEGYSLCAECGRCLKSWDFVADAIDDTDAKLALIESVYKMNIPVISSMGTGNKLNPAGFRIAPIGKTEGDPLARSIRKKLREKGIEDVPVLYSPEPPVADSSGRIPSISYMPAVAGFEIAGFIIQSIIK